MSTASSQIKLASRPQGYPTADNFRLIQASVPDPAAGQVLVRNLTMSVDPGMRPRMNDTKSYTPPLQLDQPITGAAVGEVVTSKVDALQPGDVMTHSAGWRDYAVLDAGAATKVHPTLAPLNAYLGVLGTPGLTAYVGLFKTAEFAQGDTVWVSSAAGAVGQIVGQLARLHGAARVIGSAGSRDKVTHLTDTLGFDAAFDYHDGPIVDQLAAAAPDGIDVYFDNVGGEHLEAALTAASLHARFTICGATSSYNDSAAATVPKNLNLIIVKRLQIRGIVVYDHLDLRQEFIDAVAPLVSSGQLHYEQTLFQGLEQAPGAFIRMLKGQTTGRTLVEINPH